MNIRESAPEPIASVFEALAACRAAPVAGLDAMQIDDLKALGVDIENGQAQLDDDVELLSAAAIRDALARPVVAWLKHLDVRAHIDSTNTTLLRRAASQGAGGCVLTAEVQTAGRGRRGRAWLSPFGRNLAVSIGVGIDRPVADLGALSLVVGVAVRAALVEYGVSDIELKWPNDVLLDGRKLAGILIELAQATRPAQVVIGIGINVGCRDVIAGRVDQAVADVTEGVENASRNDLLAAVINHVAAACVRFEAEGFAPFRLAWERAHRHRGMAVTVSLPSSGAPDAVSGTALGVDANGALRVQTARGVRAFVAGEVSVRSA